MWSSSAAGAATGGWSASIMGGASTDGAARGRTRSSRELVRAAGAALEGKIRRASRGAQRIDALEPAGDEDGAAWAGSVP